eukprot:COSAG01_NODE_2206_length_8170_cov_70.537108_4_plen_94_part_00
MSNQIDYKHEYNKLRKEYQSAYDENLLLREKNYSDISHQLDYDIKENILRAFELDIRIGIDTCCNENGDMMINRKVIDKYIQNYIRHNYVIDI